MDRRSATGPWIGGTRRRSLQHVDSVIATIERVIARTGSSRNDPDTSAEQRIVDGHHDLAVLRAEREAIVAGDLATAARIAGDFGRTRDKD